MSDGRPAQKNMTIFIAITGRGRAPTTFVYEQDEVRLGRSSKNDIVFDPLVDGAVSRRHAVVRKDERLGWVAQDLDSTQGTYLNGKRITGEVPLRNSDVITLGVEGPNLTVMWPDEDSQQQSDTLIQQPSPVVFPLVLYGDFAKRFFVFQKIGEGGYGQVWRARPREAEDWVAIKFLRPELLAAGSSGSRSRIDKLVARFQREADVTRRLAEQGARGIVAVREVGGDPDQGFLFMILDYIKGKSLDRIITKQREMEFRLVCRYMRQVAEALELAHNYEWEDEESGKTLRGIVHRDIKPSNIIIRKDDDRAILCDFGIAAIQEGGDRLTLPQMRVFTYKFTAPEVLIDNTIAPATDLWGLAVTTYVMLSGGHFPYSGMGLAETLRSIRERRMTPITNFRTDLPDSFVELLHKSLDPTPSVRIETAHEWAEELEKYSPKSDDSK